MAFTCPDCGLTSHHPKDEENQYCGNCHDFKGSKIDNPTGVTFWVAGIVAARNNQPYVQIANANRMIAQLTVAEARNVAKDMLISASHAEADAMFVKFFSKLDLPQGALASLMMEFREFRHQLAMQEVNTSSTDPDSGETR
jgi:hypothetical protein